MFVALCEVQTSLAQGCTDCTNECTGNGGCCVWDFPPVDMDPNSLNTPNSYPLGFVSATLPRDERTDIPDPCVVFNIPAEVVGKQNYIQVSVESDGANVR